MMLPGQLEPNALEIAVLERIAQDEPNLRDKLGDLHVLSREFTGVGSYTTFLCDGSESKLGDPRGFEGLIVMPGVPNGLGAVLYCDAGRPKCLEIYTYTDHWDGTFEGFSLGAAV